MTPNEGITSGENARLLPAFVVLKVMRLNSVQLCVRFVPNFAFEDFGLVDERSVISEHPPPTEKVGADMANCKLQYCSCEYLMTRREPRPFVEILD